MSNKFELFEDCLKRNYRASMLENGGGDRVRVWMELCRDTVFQNCLTQTSRYFKHLDCVGILALVIRQANRILYAPHYVGIHGLSGSTIFFHIIS